MWLKQFKSRNVAPGVGSFMIVVHCFFSVRDLKATLMNMKYLVQELMLSEFKLDHDIAKAIKSICCVIVEGTVHHQMVKKFSSGCKNLNDQKKSDKPKTMDSQAVLLAIEANLTK